MLLNLSVKNIVLIPFAEIELTKGLNVLTGETGAGKSIVVDCLMLLIGGRFDKSLLRYGESEGYVQGVFLLSQKAKVVMEELGLESEDIIIIKRRLSSEGRSDIKINGQTCTVSMLRKIMSTLVDIYGQHEFERLKDKGTQLALLDYYDRHSQKEIKDQLENNCRDFFEVEKQLKNLGDESSRAKEIDFLSYQISEIENSGVYKTEEEELLEKRKKALNAESIQNAINESLDILDKIDLNRVSNLLSRATDYNSSFKEYAGRIDSVAIELDDINYSLRSELNELSAQPIDLEKIEERLIFIRALQRKYGSFEEMMDYLKGANNRLEMLQSSDKIYEELLIKKQNLIKEIYDLSSRLSTQRRKSAKEFCNKINNELHTLGMEKAEFSIEFNDLPPLSECESYISANGMDEIEFYLRSNAGQPFMPLLKIISGGEMSRFMLAIKVVTGDADKTPTLVFDEIDSGISGKIGQEVAKKLAQIATKTQVICVTHLPQIAAMGEKHIYIEKQLDDNQTVTAIKNLDREGMIKEISRLSGGVGISESSEQNAKEIKNWSDEYKKSLYS